MYKFFVSQEQIEGNEAIITDEDVNHIKNVLRLIIGENICICNKYSKRSKIRAQDM